MGSNDLFSSVKKPVIDRPLIAYAFLAQASEASGDLLSGLTPIFKPIAKERVGQRFDAAEFSRVAKSLYAIEIHPWAVDDLAPRLEKAGLLIKNKISQASAEYIYAEVEGNFDEVQEADIRLVVQKFINFARPILERYQLQVDDKPLEEAFFNQLISMDFHSILLKPDRTKEDIKKEQGSKLSLASKPEKVEWETEISARSKIDVLCASFIVDSYSSDRPLYDLIVRIATGAMVAETVLNFQDPGGTANLNTLKVILDAPFLMALLDLTGEESTIYARTLCEQLAQKGATIQVFRHSIEETQSNLRGTLKAVEQGAGFGATARRLGQGVFKQYVNSIVRDVEGAVTRMGYKIVDVPTSTNAYQYFSDADEQQFTSALGYYENPHARDRDAASIAAIIRMRQGKTTKMARFHHAQYIFVTDNSRVAERSDSFTRNRNVRGANDVPPALTDRFVAGLLFILFGGKATELTHYRLLANCTAALEPRNDVIGKIHRFLSQLDQTKADHFRALMTDERASQHMMQLTLGDSVLVSSTNDAEKILEQVELKVGEKYKQEYDEKIGQLQTSHEQAIAGLVAKHEDLAEEVRSSMAEAIGVRIELKGWQDHSDELRQELVAQKQQQIALNMQQMEEKRLLIENCVSYARKIADRRHLHISLLMFGLTILSAILGTEFVTETWKMGTAAGVILSGGITSLAFWRNPDKLFGKHLEKLREDAFQRKAAEHRVVGKLDQFVVDWANGSVQLVASSSD